MVEDGESGRTDMSVSLGVSYSMGNWKTWLVENGQGAGILLICRACCCKGLTWNTPVHSILNQQLSYLRTSKPHLQAW